MGSTSGPWRYEEMGSEGVAIFPATEDKRKALHRIALVSGRGHNRH